ncbi:MAG TPA: hypothetical protein VF074_09335, partial [Pyrinomonadaceae bacterium]
RRESRSELCPVDSDIAKDLTYTKSFERSKPANPGITRAPFKINESQAGGAWVHAVISLKF